MASMIVSRKKRFPMILILIVLILLSIFISLHTGVFKLTPMEAIQALIGTGEEHHRLVLFEFRLPRIVIALLIGAGLAISGMILQGVTRNELADPGIVGIHAGAGLFVATWMMFLKSAFHDPPFIISLLAFVGGLVAALLIYLLAWRSQGVSPARLILVGIGINLLFDGILLALQMKMDPSQYQYLEIWLAGSIWATNWKFVLVLLPWIVILLPISYYRARHLNILQLGDQAATGLGIAVQRERLVLLMLAVGLAASCVSVGGGIAFVGLVAPHLARRLVGAKHEAVIPVAALLGALLLVVSDLIARQMLAPNEIPTGLVVAVIGAPYFLYLLTRTKG